MKKMTTKILIALAFLAFPAISALHAQNAKEWAVPANFSSMKNKAAAGKETLATGKELYAKHCKSCHGATGLGDGPKAGTLDVSCGDFSTAKFQAQTDGDLFYKVSEGRGKMPAFKKTIPDENDRWALVTYMRTFKGK